MNTSGHVRAADTMGIDDAAKALRAGQLVAFPTETVYGLGADATNGEAVAGIFAAKGRPKFNPLIVHVADTERAETLGQFDGAARGLVQAFWPGALTVVVARRADAGLSDLVSAGLETVALRVPSHPTAQQLLSACGLPVAAPSANATGEVSPTAAAHVAASLPGPGDGGPEIILDDGPCAVGLESTVVDLSTGAPALLRPGGIAAEAIEAITGPLLRAGSDDQAPKSPGMLSRHYAPKTPLRMNAADAGPGEAFLAFGPGPDGNANLSPAGDLTEAAANLFAMLRRLDTEGYAGIAVAPIPETGLGLAINDRLRRAGS